MKFIMMWESFFETHKIVVKNNIFFIKFYEPFYCDIIFIALGLLVIIAGIRYSSHDPWSRLFLVCFGLSLMLVLGYKISVAVDINGGKIEKTKSWLFFAKTKTIIHKINKDNFFISNEIWESGSESSQNSYALYYDEVGRKIPGDGLPVDIIGERVIISKSSSLERIQCEFEKLKQYLGR